MTRTRPDRKGRRVDRATAPRKSHASTVATRHTAPMPPRVVHASWIVPGDEAPIADGALVLDETGTVLDVGPAAEVLPRHAGAAVTREQAIVTPGLVNAHTHLELSALRGAVAGGDGFVPWVGRMMRARRGLDPDEAVDAIARGVDELVAAGTAAVADIGNGTDAYEALASRGMAGWFFLETSSVEPGGDSLTHLAERVRDHASLRTALVPHALYSTHRETLDALFAHARAQGSRLSIHLAEFAGERAYLRDRSGPLAAALAGSAVVSDRIASAADPIAAFVDTGLAGPDVLAVHLADAKRSEIERLAATGTRVVLCPRSNLFIQTLLPPLLEVLAAGIRPALGTDSLASNTSLDVLAEAAALRFRFPSVAPRTLFAMCTAYGADALGLASFGRLRAGNKPGVLAFDIPAGAPSPSDPFALILAQRPPPRRWIVSA